MKLYFKFFAMHLKSRMAYKKSFFFSVIGQFLTSFTAFLSLYFLLSRFQSVKGYTMGECLLSASIMWIAFPIAEWFFRGFDTFPNMVRSAEFDRVLVRPRGLIFQVLCQKVEFTRIGRLAQGVVTLCMGITLSGVEWTGARCLCLALMILGGVCVFSALFLIYAGLSFFTLEGLEFMNCFTDGAREHFAYPLDIYGSGFVKFGTYIIPYALFQYYPLQYLLGRAGMEYAFLPLLAPLFMLPAYALWRLGVHKYKSAGS